MPFVIEVFEDKAYTLFEDEDGWTCEVWLNNHKYDATNAVRTGKSKLMLCDKDAHELYRVCGWYDKDKRGLGDSCLCTEDEIDEACWVLAGEGYYVTADTPNGEVSYTADDIQNETWASWFEKDSTGSL